MRTKLMIDAIVRETTVLIAQLASSAGLRAPLAHLADEVFLSLSQELEAEGVPQKVAADMFGLALRTYQRRVHRLREDGTEKGATLWPSVLDFVESHPFSTRAEVLLHFSAEEPAAVAAVLADLVKSGLANRTGSGPKTRYTTTTEEVRKLIARQEDQELIQPLVWIAVCRHAGMTSPVVASQLKLEEAPVEEAVEALIEEGHVVRDEEGRLEALSRLDIPKGSEMGWEAAVLDHYQAMVHAISAKLQRGTPENQDVVGGGTLSFDLPVGHPDEAEVLGLLERLRGETRSLWERVEAHNDANGQLPDEARRVVFYFGQFVPTDEEERET